MTSGEHTKGPLKWHPRFSERGQNGAIYSEPHEGHAYAVAVQPRFTSDEEWSHDANLIVTAVNTYPAVAELVRALEKAEELYQVGLLAAPDGLFNEVNALRQSALTRFRELESSSQSREAQAGGGA